MAVTIGAWSSIDDTEVDAESPITESLMVRNRDNSYWIDAGTRKTSQTSQTKVLVPDGSNGVEWVEANTISGINGTKAAGTIGASTGSPTSITIQANKILRINFHLAGGGNILGASATIDASDDTFIALGETGSSATVTTNSGTVSGSFAKLIEIINALAASEIKIKKNGSAYEIYQLNAPVFNYVWL